MDISIGKTIMFVPLLSSSSSSCPPPATTYSILPQYSKCNFLSCNNCPVTEVAKTTFKESHDQNLSTCKFGNCSGCDKNGDGSILVLSFQLTCT
ncbi:conserved hypothetical protein [Ricinus communis]|uniref:Uncharacterized protein n=1 Tax=Ricinus communis TaxID=3988 RepID=B9S725_RICCO|nr:conserved hypothetical protein [Ricinus communis]